MSPVEPQLPSTHSAPRRRVRIVTRRRPPRAAMASLVLAITAAVLLPVVWRFWKAEVVVSPPDTGIATKELEWKCDSGHYFRASGHSFNDEGLTAHRACWVCDRPAFPVTEVVCAVHGPVEVRVRLSAGDGAATRISRLRLAGREWVSAEKGVRCARCSRPLRYTRDPLRGFRRRHDRPGG
jgi:hypothetical protein